LLFEERLPGSLERFVREASIAYVEAEFWGGEGHQAAAVWQQGERRLTAVEPEPEAGAPPRQLSDGAINQALRILG
jgi:hypothetical protein